MTTNIDKYKPKLKRFPAASTLNYSYSNTAAVATTVPSSSNLSSASGPKLKVHLRNYPITKRNYNRCNVCDVVVAFQKFESYEVQNAYDILHAKTVVLKHWFVAWDIDEDGQPWRKHIHHDNQGEKDIISRMSYGVIQPEDVLEGAA